MKYTTLLRRTFISLGATIALASTASHAASEEELSRLDFVLDLNGNYAQIDTGPVGHEWLPVQRQDAVNQNAAIAGLVDVSSSETARSYLQIAVDGPATVGFSWMHQGDGALRFYLAQDVDGEINYQYMGACESASWVNYPEFDVPEGRFWMAWQYEGTIADGTYLAGLDNVEISKKGDPFFPDAVVGSNGALTSPWFGKLWALEGSYAYYYHNYLGYIYMLQSGNAFWCYHLEAQDYLYADSTMFPYMWSQNQGWIFLMEAISTPGQRPWVYHFDSDEIYQYP